MFRWARCNLSSISTFYWDIPSLNDAIVYLFVFQKQVFFLATFPFSPEKVLVIIFFNQLLNRN